MVGEKHLANDALIQKVVKNIYHLNGSYDGNSHVIAILSTN